MKVGENDLLMELFSEIGFLWEKRTVEAVWNGRRKVRCWGYYLSALHGMLQCWAVPLVQNCFPVWLVSTADVCARAPCLCVSFAHCLWAKTVPYDITFIFSRRESESEREREREREKDFTEWNDWLYVIFSYDHIVMIIPRIETDIFVAVWYPRIGGKTVRIELLVTTPEMHHKNLRTSRYRKRDTLLHDFLRKSPWRSHRALGDRRYHDIVEKWMPMGHRKKA